MSKPTKLPPAPEEMRQLAQLGAAAIVDAVGALDGLEMNARVIVVADVTKAAGYQLARAMLRHRESLSDETVCSRLERSAKRSQQLGQRHIEARVLTHFEAMRLFAVLPLHEDTRQEIEAWLMRPPPDGGARVLAVSETIGLLHVAPEFDVQKVH